jgi:hypothetical protein
MWLNQANTVIMVTNMLQFVDIALERILSSRKKIVKYDFPSELKRLLYRVYPNSTDKLSGQILRSKISIKLLIHMGQKCLVCEIID